MSENTPLLSVDLPAELRQRQSELAQLLLEHCPRDGVYGTAVDPLALIRADGPTLPARGMHKPALCIIAQGRKEVQLAEERYIYDPLHYLVVSVTLPLAGQVIDASPDAPYLCVRLDIDPAEITQLISDAGPMEVASRRGDRGLYVDRIDASLLDAVLRLIHLLDSPRDIPMLAPLILREIFYRLLRSGQGQRLHEIAIADSQAYLGARWNVGELTLDGVDYLEGDAEAYCPGYGRSALIPLRGGDWREGTLAPEEPGLRGRLATARSLVDGRTLYCAAENAP